MSDWLIWLTAAVAVVILEIYSGTFYLLMMAIGLAAGAVAAKFGVDLTIQFIVAAVVGTIAMILLRMSKFGTPQKTEASKDPNAILDIGRTINVTEWQRGEGGKSQARVMY